MYIYIYAIPMHLSKHSFKYRFVYLIYLSHRISTCRLLLSIGFRLTAYDLSWNDWSSVYVLCIVTTTGFRRHWARFWSTSFYVFGLLYFVSVVLASRSKSIVLSSCSIFSCSIQFLFPVILSSFSIQLLYPVVILFSCLPLFFPVFIFIAHAQAPSVFIYL